MGKKIFTHQNSIQEKHSGGAAEQIADIEKHLRERDARNAKIMEHYRKRVSDLLESAPVISLVSKDAATKINKKFVGRTECIDFSIKIARIAEKILNEMEKFTKEDVICIFNETCKEIIPPDKDLEHYTWITIEVLYDTWSYGNVIREWRNKKYLGGEEGEVYNGVVDYRQGTNSLSYRIKSPFPGTKK